MAEGEKRFPWWVVTGTSVLLIFAIALGFIETVGRKGTLTGRYEQIKIGMSRAEAAQVLGGEGHVVPPFRVWFGEIVSPPFDGPQQWRHWQDGSVEVTLIFEDGQVRDKDLVDSRDFEIDLKEDIPHVWWHVRRWAEQAYTAIHGPRR